MVKKEKSSKKIARYSLFIMGLGFIITIPFQNLFWVDLIQGGFEAGLVGGLADWFAVTALFRHPLGIPIPHTALLPNNRKRMTNALVSMLKNDWLSKDSIHEKVKKIPFTEKLIRIVNKEVTTEYFKKCLVEVLKKMIHSLDVEKWTPFLKKQLLLVLSDIELKKLLHSVSTQLLTEQFDEKALNYALKQGENWLRKDQTAHQLGTVSMNVLRKVEADGILQFALKSIQNLLTADKLGELLSHLLIKVITNLNQEAEPNRKALINYIRKEVQGIENNQVLLAAIEKWKDQIINTWNPDQTINVSLRRIQQNVVEIIEEQSFIDQYLLPLLTVLLSNLKERETRIDAWVQKQITILIENNHEQIGTLVQENLDKLDNETLVSMMENNIGKDLQWIRVNGAVCGFFIGIFLTGIQTLFRLI